MKQKRSFHYALKNEMDVFLKKESERYQNENRIKIDLHCHDKNSDITDELLGRILKVPETWLNTSDLIKTLQDNGCDLFTVTNHNNARSNYELADKDIDVLVGAEFSCTVPDFNIGIHVLAYGFTKDQEKELFDLKEDIYGFLRYAKKNDIPTVWAHPLFQYKSEGLPPYDFFCKTSLLFERFEAVNGQRSTWQNLLVRSWIESISQKDIDNWSEKYAIDPKDFCKDPYRKVFTGGSDSHMGIFAGQTGSYLYVKDLNKRKRTTPLSELALEAIRNCDIAVYGASQNTEKLTVSFLDYFNQVCLNYKDPGLVRILLHKGNPTDKSIAFLISNAVSEIQRHKVTINFIDLFHKSFLGKIPSYFRKLLVPKVYKPVFESAVKIAEARKNRSRDTVEVMQKNITFISNRLNNVLFSRLISKLSDIDFDEKFSDTSLDNIINFLELPSDLRSYSGKQKQNRENMTNPDVPKFLDGLSFPLLTSAIILAANFASSKSLTHLRPLYKQFSDRIGKFKHPERALWLTDTFEDRNGVSMSLKAMLKEIQERDLPIDILICSNNIKPEKNLIVIKPEMEFVLPFYKQQPVRIPNFLKIHSIFEENEYDRIICSTEGIMGAAALYLKHAYSVPAYFYIHTDWMTFSKDVLGFSRDEINRVRRFLRAYYGAFDKLFVLNRDQKEWLTGNEMGFESNNVLVTAHWIDDLFRPVNKVKKDRCQDDSVYYMETPDIPTMLYAGRISKEKGVLELPEIYRKVKESTGQLRMVIAGTGPAEKELKKALPEAEYPGWVDHDKLPLIYSEADLFVFPSKFDTFGCVVLEAMGCGLPVISYNIKGPKDIINNNINGYLVETGEEMIEKCIEYFSENTCRGDFRKNAILQSKNFTADSIISDFMKAVELK